MKMQKGFTLIELMIVIAILGILIAIALPAYQDYTIRAKVTEGLNLAAAAKLGSSETRLSNGTWPASAALAGYTPAASLIASVDVPAAQEVLITYDGANAPPEITGKTLYLYGSIDATGIVQWECLADTKTTGLGATNVGTLAAKYAPANCR